jgi:hypothetical protein
MLVPPRWKQVNPKSAAFAGLGFHPRTPTQPLGTFADQGQANPRTGVRVRVVQPIEEPENPFVVFWRDANTVVFEPKPGELEHRG